MKPGPTMLHQPHIHWGPAPWQWLFELCFTQCMELEG